MAQGILSRMRHIGRDLNGAAAVEFALIAPCLIALYFGLAEYCQAMMADRKVAHVASTMGDLVAQGSSVTNADMSDIFTIGRTMLSPFSSTPLKMRISSVTVNANNVPKVDWSDASGGLTAYSVGSTVTLPANSSDSTKPFVASGDTIIMSEAQYTYTSPVGVLMKAPKTFTEKFYLRPRISNTIARTAS